MPRPGGLPPRRRPEHTVLHRAVRENLETWLEHHAEYDDFSVPERIDAEFRRYLLNDN